MSELPVPSSCAEWIQTAQLRQQAELVAGPLAPTCEREHEEVEARLVGGRRLGDKALDDQDPHAGITCLDASN